MVLGKKTGATKAIKEHLKGGGVEFFTKLDVVAVLEKQSIPTKWAGNVITGLKKQGLVKPLDRYKGMYKLYKVIKASPPEDPEPQPRQHADATYSELEDQLLAEMQKVEDLTTKIKTLEQGLEVDFFTLGKSVYMTHQDLLQKYNALEANRREETAKFQKIHTEDRSMVGSLQKNIKKLEAEIRALRARLQVGNGRTKPDMSIFNSPKIVKG